MYVFSWKYIGIICMYEILGDFVMIMMDMIMIMVMTIMLMKKYIITTIFHVI